MPDLLPVWFLLSVTAAVGALLVVRFSIWGLRIRDPRLRLILYGMGVLEVLLVTAGASSGGLIVTRLELTPLIAREIVAPLTPWVVTVWAAVALLLVCVRLRRSATLSRRAHALATWFPAPREVSSYVAGVCSRAGAPRPRIAFVPEDASPFVVGVRRPCLVLPAALWARLDPAAREALLLHEAVHLRRRDNGVLLACALLADVLFFNWPLRMLLVAAAREVEALVDGAALGRGASASGLARSLASGRRARAPRPLSCAFASGRPDGVEHRLGLLRRPPLRAVVAAQAILMILLLPWALPGRGATGVDVRDARGRAQGLFRVAMSYGPNPAASLFLGAVLPRQR